MKLFHQLLEEEQNSALHHCANIVMDDLLEEGVKLEPLTDDEIAIKAKLEAAVEETKTMATREEKVDHLLRDEVISQTIYDVALEMAKSAWYHDNTELIIFIDELNAEPEDVKELLLPEAPKTKKISHLN